MCGRFSGQEASAGRMNRTDDHGDQAVSISESVGSTDEKFNLVVCSLYTDVGDAVLGSCYDGSEVPLDLQPKFPKGGDSACAILAGQATGNLASFSAWNRPAHMVYPDEERHAQYQERLQKFIATYPLLQAMRKIAGDGR